MADLALRAFAAAIRSVLIKDMTVGMEGIEVVVLFSLDACRGASGEAKGEVDDSYAAEAAAAVAIWIAAGLGVI